MEPAEFTLTLKGAPDEVGRVLRAAFAAYSAVEKEAADRLTEMYRLNLGDRFVYPRGPYCSLRGKVTIKNVDAEVLGF